MPHIISHAEVFLRFLFAATMFSPPIVVLKIIALFRAEIKIDWECRR